MSNVQIGRPTPSLKNIKDLSNITGCGMMYCKKALLYSDGDMQKAEALLQDLTGGIVIRPNPWDEAEKKWKEKYEGENK